MKLVKIYERMEELKCELEDIERDLAVAINSLMDAMEILEEYI